MARYLIQIQRQFTIAALLTLFFVWAVTGSLSHAALQVLDFVPLLLLLPMTSSVRTSAREMVALCIAVLAVAVLGVALYDRFDWGWSHLAIGLAAGIAYLALSYLVASRPAYCAWVRALPFEARIRHKQRRIIAGLVVVVSVGFAGIGCGLAILF